MISICIPVYKEPFKVVKGCLDSCAKIDYPNFEVLIVEAKPQDTSVKQYCKKKGFKYIKRETTKGFKAGAMNYVVKKARGELLFILDSDEKVDPSLLRKGVGVLTAYPKAAFVQFFKGFWNKNTESAIMLYTGALLNDHLQKSLDLSNGVIPHGSGVLLKKNVFEKVGGYPEIIVEDFGLNVRLKNKGYWGVYYPHCKVTGLAPESFEALYTPLKRWSSGLTEVLLKQWRQIFGAPWSQKINLFSSTLIYLFFSFQLIGFLSYSLIIISSIESFVSLNSTITMFSALIFAFLLLVALSFGKSLKFKYLLIMSLSIVPISLRTGLYALTPVKTFVRTPKLKSIRKNRFFKALPDLGMLVFSLYVFLISYNLFFLWAILSYSFIIVTYFK
jgi:cellulose synthase/poly-beta-1,6-N-acetylglucosamine synthase-like glycosyltransferase